MILIPAGKFILGSNSGEKDEAPEQIIKLDDFYIDKYEVTNSDYYLYIIKSNSKPPISWVKGTFNDGEDNFPVIVSYNEAVKYAEWASKRLPTEEEWEKAARGTGLEIIKDSDGVYYVNEKPIIYPWGNKFDPSKTNSVEFWETKNIGEEIKKKYNKGLLPVHMFQDEGNSVYGVVNMCGNASEWTSSWYSAYKGSKYIDKMFGKQVKVIRGGSWFSLKDKLRVSNREYGGIPNLYEDNIAGFRCVKDPTIIDRK
jgi:formylglycine-generating enzyme required for sulfatase activity